jgi:hypothetical protein
MESSARALPVIEAALAAYSAKRRSGFPSKK